MWTLESLDLGTKLSRLITYMSLGMLHNLSELGFFQLVLMLDFREMLRIKGGQIALADTIS